MPMALNLASQPPAQVPLRRQRAATASASSCGRAGAARACPPASARSRQSRVVPAALAESRELEEEQGRAQAAPRSVEGLGFRGPVPSFDGAYSVLRGNYDYPKLKAFFSQRPWEVAGRFATFAATFATIARAWTSQENLPLEQRTRGAVLRDCVSSLGAAAVKCGQTLAERPDLIGDEAAGYLKQLQGENAPFDNALAWQIIAEDLGWAGPLAPGCPHAASAPGPVLFAQLSSQPIAAASLAQVYYAVTHEGKELAIKVQRPGLLRCVALDMLVLRLILDGCTRYFNTIADLSVIADEVGAGVFRELDVHEEAANAAEFERRLSFLGFVRVPHWDPLYSGPKGTARVLAMEWVRGRRLQQLPLSLQRRFVDMAVEASVAQLIRTGFVHADPHAGNLMLDDEGNLVFLDFGLMCTVEPHIMEAFASGVVHLLAGDWRALAYDFQACGLVPPVFEARNDATGGYEEVSVEVFSEGIRQAICGEADGLTRFGALATGLGGASGRFRFLCPPFIILLCRTFLTLEGMAGLVDPGFSIYSSALPYAVRRALSPETEKGEAALRSALLTETGAFRWSRLNEVLAQVETLQQTRPEDAAAQQAPESDGAAVPAAASGGGGGGGMSTVTGLLGAPEGAALRRVIRDADTLLLVQHLTGKAGRPLRRAGVKSLAAALQGWHAGEGEIAAGVGSRRELRDRQRLALTLRVLGANHMQRLFEAGLLRGIAAVLRLGWLAVRVGIDALLRGAWRIFGAWWAKPPRASLM